MNYYFLNLLFLLQQASSNTEVVHTHHTLQYVAWVLIISTIIIFILFGYMIYMHYQKKKDSYIARIQKNEQEIHQ